MGTTAHNYGLSNIWFSSIYLEHWFISSGVIELQKNSVRSLSNLLVQRSSAALRLWCNFDEINVIKRTLNHAWKKQDSTATQITAICLTASDFASYLSPRQFQRFYLERSRDTPSSLSVEKPRNVRVFRNSIKESKWSFVQEGSSRPLSSLILNCRWSENGNSDVQFTTRVVPTANVKD